MKILGKEGPENYLEVFAEMTQIQHLRCEGKGRVVQGEVKGASGQAGAL